jgi:hypothetical protein
MIRLLSNCHPIEVSCMHLCLNDWCVTVPHSASWFCYYNYAILLHSQNPHNAHECLWTKIPCHTILWFTATLDIIHKQQRKIMVLCQGLTVYMSNLLHSPANSSIQDLFTFLGTLFSISERNIKFQVCIRQQKAELSICVSGAQRKAGRF